MAQAQAQAAGDAPAEKKKLFGRAFYESIGSPKHVVAPMVDQSEFVSVCPLRQLHSGGNTKANRVD